MKHPIDEFTIFGQPVKLNEKISYAESPVINHADFFTLVEESPEKRDTEVLAATIVNLSDDVNYQLPDDGSGVIDWSRSERKRELSGYFNRRCDKMFGLSIGLDQDIKLTDEQKALLGRDTLHGVRTKDDLDWEECFNAEETFSFELKDVLINSQPLPIKIKLSGTPSLSPKKFRMAQMLYEKQEKLIEFLQGNPTVYFGGPLGYFLPLKEGMHRLAALTWEDRHVKYAKNKAAKMADPAFRAVKTKLGMVNKIVAETIRTKQAEHGFSLTSSEAIDLDVPYRDGTANAGMTKHTRLLVNFERANMVSRITLQRHGARYSRGNFAMFLESEVSKAKFKTYLQDCLSKAQLTWHDQNNHLGQRETAYVRTVVFGTLLNELF